MLKKMYNVTSDIYSTVYVDVGNSSDIRIEQGSNMVYLDKAAAEDLIVALALLVEEEL